MIKSWQITYNATSNPIQTIIIRVLISVWIFIKLNRGMYNTSTLTFYPFCNLHRNIIKIYIATS